MPLYEYQCESCEHRFERIQKYTDPLPDECPKCGGAVRKLMSSPAIQFKGTGWYITDYAKKPAADAGKTGGKSEGTSEKSDSSGDKSDTSGKQAAEKSDTAAPKSDTPAATNPKTS